jgi:hypothetical protein
MKNRVIRFLKVALCGIQFHMWEPIENKQFNYTGLFRCKNCGRKHVLPLNE